MMTSNLRIKISILYFLMNVFLNTSIRAQENSNSLRKIWKDPKQNEEKRFNAINRFYILNTFSNPSASREAATLHLALAKQKKNLRQTIKAYNEMAITNYLIGMPDSSLFYMEESIGIAEQLNDPKLLGKQYNNHGNALRNAGRYKEAVKRFSQSKSIFEKLNNEFYYQAIANNNLGLIYYDVGLYDISKSYLEKALSLYKKAKGNEVNGSFLVSLGQVNYELGEITQAKAAINRAIPMLLAEKNSISSAHAYLITASIYDREQKLDSAVYFLNLGYETIKDFGHDNSILEALVDKLNFEYNHGLNISTDQEERVAQLLRLTTNIQTKADAAQLLYTLYKSHGKDSDAFKMLELYTRFTDTMNLNRDKFTIIRETLKSDFDNQMLLQQIENERIQTKKEMSHFKKMFSIALVSLITVLLVIGYFRKKIKTNREERAALLEEIEQLKKNGLESEQNAVSMFELNKAKLEEHMQKKMNETDWAVLNVLLENPVISNKELAEKVFLSSDGVGSSLRRMYVMFDVQESKYMKIGLLLKAIKISNHS